VHGAEIPLGRLFKAVAQAWISLLEGQIDPRDQQVLAGQAGHRSPGDISPTGDAEPEVLHHAAGSPGPRRIDASTGKAGPEPDQAGHRDRYGNGLAGQSPVVHHGASDLT
jgi:hypothetical protein